MNRKKSRPIVRFTLLSILALNGACASEVDTEQGDDTRVEADAKDEGTQKQVDVDAVKVDVQPKLSGYDLITAKKK